MSRIIDKIIILALSVFAMCYTIHGNTFLVAFYTAIIISALDYYLIGRNDITFSMKQEKATEYVALVLEILIVVSYFFFPPIITIFPVVIYDSARSRNYIAIGLAAAILVMNLLSSDFGIGVILYIMLATVIAAVMCTYTEERLYIKKEYRSLRDNTEEQSAKLRSRNAELIRARDTEIYNAQLSERNRIAREIHDNVGHTLSRAILQMGALLAIHKEEPIHSELEGVRQTLDDAMNNIRSSVHDLHDDSIDVKASIDQMASELKGKYNVHVDLDIRDDTPRPVKYAIIGITKECISNIIKYSTNTDVDIRLNEHPSMYQLIIHDYTLGDSHIRLQNEAADTKDFGADSRNGNDNSVKHSKTDKKNKKDVDYGMGLENIRGRVESVNGNLTITNDNGFRVFVTIPK